MNEAIKEKYQKITGLKAIKNGRLTKEYILWLEIIAKKYFEKETELIRK